MSIDLSALPNQSELPDSETLEEAENNTATLNSHLKDAQVKRFLTDTSLRTVLVYFFSIVILLWLASVMVVVFLNDSFVKLSDNVMTVLLTTTTINVIGMMLIILRNLFPHNSKWDYKND